MRCKHKGRIPVESRQAVQMWRHLRFRRGSPSFQMEVHQALAGASRNKGSESTANFPDLPSGWNVILTASGPQEVLTREVSSCGRSGEVGEDT